MSRKTESKPITTCCHNVAGMWIGRLEGCKSQARIFSPYITKLAEQALRAEHVQNIEIYTCFNLMTFVSGASCLKTLRKLKEGGYPLFHLAKLHAKVFEYQDGEFATVGSQNMTNGGTKNREATVVIRSPDLLQKLKMQLDKWVEKRIPISLEMLLEAEPIVAEYRRVIKSLRKTCTRFECGIFEQQAKRDELSKSKQNAAAHVPNAVVHRPGELNISDSILTQNVGTGGNEVTRLETPMTVKQFAETIGVRIYRVNQILIKMNIFASPHTLLTSELISVLRNAFLETTIATQQKDVSSVGDDDNGWRSVVAELDLKKYQRERTACLAKLGSLDVPYEVCYRVARQAHVFKINGRMNRCPGDAKHLKQGLHGWEINLGGNQANRMGIEYAIKLCRTQLAQNFPEDKIRIEMLNDTEKRTLAFYVEYSVIDHNNRLYKGNFPKLPNGLLNINGTHYLNPYRTAEAIVMCAGFNKPLI